MHINRPEYVCINRLVQFTYDEFVDQNDVHFLDIKITSNGTTIF